MLHLQYSHRVEALVRSLHEHVTARRAERRTGVYETIAVLTPNLAFADYLELALARHAGICANVEFSLLHRFVQELVGSNPRFDDVVLLTRKHLQLLVLDRLADPDFVARAPLAGVARYIDTGQDARARDVRRFQLSDRLAALFEEYEYSRADMLDCWRRDTSYFASRPDVPQDVLHTERWQRELWLAAVGEAERVGADGRHLMSLTTAIDLLMKSPAKLECPDLHLFGFAHISPTFLRLFEFLATSCEIHVWSLQPSPVTHDSSGLSPHNPDHLARQQWARLSDDMLAMLGTLDLARVRVTNVEPRDGDRDDDRDGDGETSVLGCVQADIRGVRRAVPPAADRSVSFIAATGIRRELEAVANDIWTRMAADDALHFNDFAIVLAGGERTEYVAQLDAVFSAFHDLPFNLYRIAGAEPPRVVEALRMLLALPVGRFHRREVMGLLMHPNVGGLHADGDPDAWLAWCHALNVIEGDRHGDDGRATYVERDLYNWSQGVRRLSLGCFMSGERSDVRALYHHGGHDYLPEEVSGPSVAHAARMNVLVRSLLADARWLAGQEHTLAGWSEIFTGLVDAYLGPARDGDDGYRSDLAHIGLCKHLIAELAARDVTATPLTYQSASLFVRQALDGLAFVQGRPLSSGVVVSTPELLRGIPFEHVYLLGMGSGEFPEGDRNDPLDLRAAERRTGDVEPNARDRQAFLDLLLSARRSFTTSRVAREASTGESIEPSSLVSELETCLRAVGVDPRTCRERHPLRRFERACGYFESPPGLPPDPAETRFSPDLGPNHLPEARIEAHLQAAGERLRALANTHDSDLPEALELAEGLVRYGAAHPQLAPRAATLAGWMRVPIDTTSPRITVEAPATSAAVAASAGPPRRLRVSLSQLRGFLESPLQGSAKVQLGIYEDEDDALATTTERFHTDALQNAIVLRSVFDRALAGPLQDADLDALYRATLLPWRELRGDLPTGFFLDKTREAHLRTLEIWKQNAECWSSPDVGLWRSDLSLEPVRFETEPEAGSAHFAPMRLTFVPERGRYAGEPVEVELYGTSEPFCEATRALMTCLPRYDLRFKDWLRLHVSRLALAASGVAIEHLLVNVENPNFGKPGSKSRLNYIAKHSRTVAPLDADAARSQLEALAGDLIGQPHGYLLPVDLVDAYVRSRNNDKPFDPHDWLREALEKDYGKPSCAYGPIKDYDRYDVPGGWERLIDARFRHHPAFSTDEPS